MAQAPDPIPPGSPASPWRTVDPRQVPVEQRYHHLPAVPAERLAPHWLRQRVAQPPPAWEPEHRGDLSRVAGRPMRPAAVLVPVVAHDHGATVLLTQRPAHMREHAGQVAFPGGRTDESDGTPENTALREAWEEVGLPREHVDVIGRLPRYVTGTGYEVTPVVALVRPGFQLRLQAGEVADAFEVPLSFLMDPRHHERRRLVLADLERDFLAMPYSDGDREFFIWGATAAMLRNFYRLLMA
jgi:8-oxo-dGTP pyrophosphatase MutT (NUDIX family)